MRKSKPHIVINGPESTGKSTLCHELSSHYDIVTSVEYARTYLNILNKVYSMNDLIKMAMIHDYRIQRSITIYSDKLCISDTDLLNYIIWSKVKFGYIDINLQRMYERLKPDLYLICEPDMPWEPDPLRENPNNRYELFEMYLDEIIRSNIEYKVISGSSSDRNIMSIRSIDGQLNSIIE